jgi:hypothetical protein
MEESNYGKVCIETKGADARDTDALECLLALCRTIGLRYQITETGIPSWPYLVSVSWSSWPTDFYEPRKRGGGQR